MSSQPADEGVQVDPHIRVDKNYLKRFGFVRTRHRKCQNVFCLGIFLAAFLGYIVIGSLGIHYGRPYTFLYGIDYQGNVCGTESFAQQPYIVYPRTNQDFLWNLNTKNPLDYKFFGICTDKCPGIQDSIDFVCDYDIYDPRTTRTFPLARDQVLDCLGRQDRVAECRHIRTHCWYVPVVTQSVLFRCIPRYDYNYTNVYQCVFPANILDAKDPNCLVIKSTTTTESEEPATPVLMFDQLNQIYYSWGRYVTDLARGWWVIVVSSIAMPALVSFLWLLSMKKYTRGVICSSIVVLLTAGILFTVFLFAQAGTIYYDWIAQYNLEKYAFLSNDMTLYLAYGMSFLLSIIVLVMIALRKSILRSIDILRLGSKALRKLPMTLVFPVFIVVILFGVFCWAAFVAASLASAGDTVVVSVHELVEQMQVSTNSTLAKLVLDKIANSTEQWNGTLTYYAGNKTLNWLQIYNVFMFLWSFAYAQGFVIMVISSSVGMWYFSKNKSKQPNLRVHTMPTFYIMDSVFRTLLFHMGTIAIGSCLIAILSSVRWFVLWIYQQLNMSRPTAQYIPATVKMALDCIAQCLLRWLQTLLEIVTHYSYIYSAIKGDSFAESGRQVFGLVLKYTTLLASVSVMCTSVIFLCKMSICVAASFMYYMIVSSVYSFGPDGANAITSPVISIIVCFLLSYAITTAFFNVFDISVDTILICYVTDIDENYMRHMGDPKFRFPAHVKQDHFSFLPPIQPYNTMNL